MRHPAVKMTVAALALQALAACTFVGTNINLVTGNGVQVDKPVEVGAFDAISSRGSIDVVYTQTPGAQSVTLTCDENLVDYYRIAVEDGTLVIDTKPGASFRTRTRALVTINSPALGGMEVRGSGSLRVTSPLANVGVDATVSGSGSILLDGAVECRSFSAAVSGSGGIKGSGVLADEAAFKVSGSGSIRLGPVTAEEVSVRGSGSGAIFLSCRGTGAVDAHLSGSGGLHLSGDARSLRSETTGSGRVHSKGLSLL